MSGRQLHLLLAALLMGCVRGPRPSPVLVEDDRSIAFPEFSDDSVVELQPEQRPYVLEGALLQALMIATNDFLPPPSKDVPCQDRPEAQRYLAMRRGDLFFIHISEDPAACGKTYPALDSGAWYAISKDGRIRRRVVDGRADAPTDAGGGDSQAVPAEPGVAPALDSVWNDPSRPWPEGLRDGGSPGSSDAGTGPAAPP
ncbi:hypothetical protein D7V97_32595 [Corallococcus sp. CA053C]|uniref:hypothetical protein n=1 Tax=Corallococcus sp. CA053C TaxID=2316732 RepID=UPI000EA0B85E|nr:hypothetical protein [Corallococcus sp. CA053C]RKG98746.1 hypothetical protein D7V97_32595 [Corallococcus sp. CA053C]